MTFIIILRSPNCNNWPSIFWWPFFSRHYPRTSSLWPFLVWPFLQANVKSLSLPTRPFQDPSPCRLRSDVRGGLRRLCFNY